MIRTNTRQTYSKRETSIRFRRWSRQGYAAFISIQRAVTIGRLAANVSERFQVKQEVLHANISETYIANSGSNDLWEKKEEDNIALSLSLRQEILPVRTTKAIAIPVNDT